MHGENLKLEDENVLISLWIMVSWTINIFFFGVGIFTAMNCPNVSSFLIFATWDSTCPSYK